MVNRLAVSWVLAKKVRAAGPRGIARVVHIYWTGGNDGFGKSPFLSDAYRFSTARAARDCAGTHRLLRDSDEWFPVRFDRAERPSRVQAAGAAA